jgi:hypothetical protein
MEDKWKELLKYIAQNNETESRFLSPNPQSNVEIIGLLDEIARLRGITKEENGREFNSICDALEEGEVEDIIKELVK